MSDIQSIVWNIHIPLGSHLRIPRTQKFTHAFTFFNDEANIWKSNSTALTSSECLHKVSYNCCPVIPPLSLPPESGSTILFKGEDGMVVFNMTGTKSFYQGELVSLFTAPLSRWMLNIFPYSQALLADNSCLRDMWPAQFNCVISFIWNTFGHR